MDRLVQEAPEYSGSGNPLAKVLRRGRWKQFEAARESPRQHAKPKYCSSHSAKRRPHLALAIRAIQVWLQGSLEHNLGTIAPLFAKCRIRGYSAHPQL